MKMEKIIKRMKKELERRERKTKKLENQLDSLLAEAMRITEYGFKEEKKEVTKV